MDGAQEKTEQKESSLPVVFVSADHLPSVWSTSAKKGLLILISLGLILHFFRILDHNVVMFDETYFGKFVTSYCCSHRYFTDIHPPHAKLLISGVSYLGGYRGGYEFEKIGDDYGDVPILALRLLPMLVGSIIPGLAFTLLIQMGVSPAYAFLGGFLIAFDNGILIQTRLIMLDGFLLAAILGSLMCHLFALGSSNLFRLAMWQFGMGAFTALAVGTKFTGLTAVALNCILFFYYSFKGKFFRDKKLFLIYSFVPIASFFAIYLGGWWLHWSLLDLNHVREVFYYPQKAFWADTWGAHKAMLRANITNLKGHSYASPWWSWPLMRRGILYLYRNPVQIQFLGNPALWWGSTVIGYIGLVNWLLNWRRTPSKLRPALTLFAGGYVIAYIPYIGVERTLFLYHYLPPLLFAWMFAVTWLYKIASEYPFVKRHEQKMLLTIGALGVAGFIVMSPMTLGYMPFPSYFEVVYSIFPSWR